MAYTYKHVPLYQLSVTRRTGMTDGEWQKELRTINGRNRNYHLSHFNTYGCSCKAKVGAR